MRRSTSVARNTSRVVIAEDRGLRAYGDCADPLAPASKLARSQSTRHSADPHHLILSHERRRGDEPLHGIDASFFFGGDDVEYRRRDTEGNRLDAFAPQLGLRAEVLLNRVDDFLDVHVSVGREYLDPDDIRAHSGH